MLTVGFGLYASDYIFWCMVFSVWHWWRLVCLRRWRWCGTLPASRITRSHSLTSVVLFVSVRWGFLWCNEYGVRVLFKTGFLNAGALGILSAFNVHLWNTLSTFTAIFLLYRGAVTFSSTGIELLGAIFPPTLSQKLRAVSHSCFHWENMNANGDGVRERQETKREKNRRYLTLFPARLLSYLTTYI